MALQKERMAFWVFLLPGLLFYLVAVSFPILESIRLSLYTWGGIGQQRFVGIDNYAHMLVDQVFYQAFVNNLIYLFIAVGMQLGIGLFFAILLLQLKRFSAAIKTLYYIPCIITSVAISQLFRSMYSTEPLGLVNLIFQSVGLGSAATTWLTDVQTVLVAVSIPEGWRFSGMYMVIFFAALISIDPEVEEAAKIDGSGVMRTLFAIKLPMIRPVFLLALTMAITGALRGFEIPFLLTNGGPGNVSELMSTYMYKKAFSSNQFGYGSTLAVTIIIESVLVVLLLRYLFRDRKEKL